MVQTYWKYTNHFQGCPHLLKILHFSIPYYFFSCRRRNTSRFASRENSLPDMKFPPSFRMNRSHSFASSRSAFGSRGFQRRRVLSSIKKKANALKESIPTIKDVNIIDKYSRVVFPLSFICFNLGYWCFYLFWNIFACIFYARSV